MCLAGILSLSLSQPTQAQSQTTTLAQRGPVPSLALQTSLVKYTFVALDQAMRTGNFSIFYQLSAPAFQQTTTPQALAQAFRQLAVHNMDLSQVMSQPVVFTEPVRIDDAGFLSMKGAFRLSKSRQANFVLSYSPVGTSWRLMGLSVAPAALQPQIFAQAQKQETAQALAANKGESATPSQGAAGGSGDVAVSGNSSTGDANSSQGIAAVKPNAAETNAGLNSPILGLALWIWFAMFAAFVLILLLMIVVLLFSRRRTGDHDYRDNYGSANDGHSSHLPPPGQHSP